MNHSLRRFLSRQIEIEDKRHGSAGFHLGCDFLQLVCVARGKHDRREVACEPDSGGAANPLACTRNDGNRIGMMDSPFVESLDVVFPEAAQRIHFKRAVWAASRITSTTNSGAVISGV